MDLITLSLGTILAISQPLLSILGLGTAAVGVQLAVLAVIAIFTISILVLSTYFGYKELHKIFSKKEPISNEKNKTIQKQSKNKKPRSTPPILSPIQVPVAQEEQPDLEIPHKHPIGNRKILCIDFDLTITAQHTHNTLVQWTPFQILKNGVTRLKNNGELVQNNIILASQGHEIPQQIQEFSKTCPLREADKMLLLIQTAIENGHKVAITSFNSFPDIIPLMLLKMGLSQNELDQIIIIGGFPEEGPSSLSCKGQHVEAALSAIAEEYNIDELENSNIMLIDDSHANIQNAKSRDYTPIHVPLGSDMMLNPAITFVSEKIKKPTLKV